MLPKAAWSTYFTSVSIDEKCTISTLRSNYTFVNTAGMLWQSRRTQLSRGLRHAKIVSSDWSNISFQLRATARFWQARPIHLEQPALLSAAANPIEPAAHVSINPECHCGNYTKDAIEELRDLRQCVSGDTTRVWL